ncbi:tail fiber domain-containing protein [Burkholderia territorii]|uniref:tail fiber domain-containing protein n=1 Tax=Burkholderia territorii TaxID=1503055 RepID=UPI00075E8680|nr:tail fiber domain-containing protein [Burkholderia territorii]KUZ35283.1 hypothetical protein WS52_04795 [Burkholderia territorii]KUZ46450.1 hypothetical protein WS53_27465 [Burkholderia territorii]
MPSILPNGKVQFIDSNGRPLVGGQVSYFEPNTETKKDTFRDSDLTVPNDNPVTLDGAGRATIWGTGMYRQVVKDRKGNLLWDEVVASPVSDTDLAHDSGASMIGFDGGTLADYFKAKSPRIVSSIAELRTLNGTKFQQAFATSYYGDGDIKSSGYFRKAYDVAPAGWENGGSQIVANDGAGWQLLRDRFSVSNFGAGHGQDDTAAISAAVKASPAGDSQAAQNASIPSCDWTEVEIPAGSFKVSDYVDTAGKEVNYLVHPGAVIDNPQYLNGRITRLGSKTGDFHHGITDSATTLSVTANRRADEQAQVSGFADPSYLSKGNGADSVALYVSNRLPTAQYGTGAVSAYTATRAVLSTPLSAMYLKQMRKGMIIRTRHTPQAYRGIVTAWDPNGSWIDVSSWYLVDGSTSGPPATPPGTAGLDVNAFRKAWAINANVFIDTNSYGSAVNGMELGVQNLKAEAQSRGGPIEANGYYVTNIDGTGAFYIDAGYLAAGRMSYGFKANGGVTYAFYHDASVNPVGDAPVALIYAKDITGTPYFHVKPDGTMEVGKRGNAGTMTLDMHSGTADADYDVRWQSSGGTGVTGGGTASIFANAIFLQAASNIDAYATLRPFNDNSISCGTVPRRWSQVCAGTGSIVTSDATEKQQVRALSDAELRVAARLMSLPRVYKFNDSVAAKGGDARWHAGVIAQDVKAAFEAEGLDGMQYGVLCYDEWQDEFVEHQAEYTFTPAEYSPLLGEDGNPILLKEAEKILVKEAWSEKVLAAGNRYGVRYDELNMFMLAALFATISTGK